MIYSPTKNIGVYARDFFVGAQNTCTKCTHCATIKRSFSPGKIFFPPVRVKDDVREEDVLLLLLSCFRDYHKDSELTLIQQDCHSS